VNQNKKKLRKFSFNFLRKVMRPSWTTMVVEFCIVKYNNENDNDNINSNNIIINNNNNVPFRCRVIKSKLVLLWMNHYFSVQMQREGYFSAWSWALVGAHFKIHAKKERTVLIGWNSTKWFPWKSTRLVWSILNVLITLTE